MLLLVNLPLDILKHLQSYLLKDDIRYFLNSNKLHFSSLKQETIYFSLNKEKSQEYVENERFREMILSKVKDGSKQIGLKFHHEYKVPDICDIVAQKIDFADFGECYPHLLNISSQSYYLPSEVKEIPFLPMSQDLKLYKCSNIRDFSSLSHLRKLLLQDASQLTDITSLQNIPNLTFIDCPNIQNFSILSSKKQKFLYIYESTITDVSFLRNMLKVDLCFLDHLVDVSPLHGIKDLSLLNCYSIRDISCLGNHGRLRILNCPSIKRGYECFRTVRHAEISKSEVPDLSVFQELKSLEINFLDSMENQLYLLKDIPELTFLAESMDRKEVYDISHLRNIRLTIYRDIIKLNESIFPSQLRHLEVERCNQIVKIIHEGKTSIFHHLQSLQLTSCSIEHVNGLGDIPTVIIVSCLSLHDISGLGKNRCVELRYCPLIRDVSSLATVPIVTVIGRNWKGKIDFSCLSSVPRLRIVE